MIVSYNRVSTAEQNPSRQMQDAAEYGRNYLDKISGTVPFAERPAGKALLKAVEKGEVTEIHFHAVDRIGRDVRDITNTIHDLADRKVQVYIRKEGIRLLQEDGSINPTAQLILGVMTALAGMERALIRERQLEGIALAKARGAYIGRHHGTTESAARFLSKPKSVRIRKLLDDGMNQTQVAKVLDVSPITVRKVQRLTRDEE
jgi:DNA invertase Pin-like site-specific DNA recombinase